jgi:hypothetical protein
MVLGLNPNFFTFQYSTLFYLSSTYQLNYYSTIQLLLVQWFSLNQILSLPTFFHIPHILYLYYLILYINNYYLYFFEIMNIFYIFNILFFLSLSAKFMNMTIIFLLLLTQLRYAKTTRL